MRQGVITGIAVVTMGLTLAFVGCNRTNSPQAGAAGDDTTALGKLEQELAALPMDSINYALGYAQGRQLQEFGLRISERDLLRGLQDGLAGKETISEEQAGGLLRRYVQLYSRVKSERNARRSIEWLDSAAAVEGMQRSESGLVYRVVTPGEGSAVNDSSYVQVHIRIREMSGKELENTQGGEPISFRLDRSLQCWAEGLKYIREGGAIELYSPASLAYGAYGANGIAPNSAMRFDVTLVKVLTKEEYDAAMQARREAR